MDSKKEKLIEKGYFDVKFEARDFKPGFRLLTMGKEYDLQESDLHIFFDGEVRQLVAVFEANGHLKQCPVCKAECPENSMVILTEYHTVYPCWVCNQLVERVIDQKCLNLGWVA